MTFSVILVFLIQSVLLYLGNKNFALNAYKKIGIIEMYYPKRYVKPSRLIKRQFKLKYNKMLKFYYYELLIADLFILMFVLNSLIFATSNFNFVLAKYLFALTFYAELLNAIVSFLITVYYNLKVKCLICDKSKRPKKKP